MLHLFSVYPNKHPTCTSDERKEEISGVMSLQQYLILTYKTSKKITHNNIVNVFLKKNFWGTRDYINYNASIYKGEEKTKH